MWTHTIYGESWRHQNRVQIKILIYNLRVCVCFWCQRISFRRHDCARSQIATRGRARTKEHDLAELCAYIFWKTSYKKKHELQICCTQTLYSCDMRVQTACQEWGWVLNGTRSNAHWVDIFDFFFNSVFAYTMCLHFIFKRELCKTWRNWGVQSYVLYIYPHCVGEYVLDVFLYALQMMMMIIVICSPFKLQ